ncbi:hypothetical protein THRCLA_00231 [Thraustotheca clavata]|uniref:Secreted protein n=1 Tax=Thraustotheca clavata TaxID=74557 RepID=A0A0A7CLS5_9STRA|nr:secreted protein [Thraustotheca clavata]OQS07775.1 hypothetical protein THRCLA_00231 [Thraustotheca clavata]
MPKGTLLLSFLATVFAQDLPNWGKQDLWVHTSTWTPTHCQCYCERLCSHPTDYLKTNLVSSGIVPHNYDWSIPFCNGTIRTYNSDVVRSVGQSDLQTYFPLTMSRDLEHMWDPDSTDPRTDIGQFSYPCGGLHEAKYLKTIVQIAKFIRTPDLIKSNIGKNITTKSIREAFKKEQNLSVVLLCSNGAFADVVTCWSKSTPFLYQTTQASQDIAPAKPVQCPPGIVALDSCKDEYSFIHAMNTTSAPTTVPTSPTPAPPTATPSPSQDPDEVDAWVKNFTKDNHCALFGEDGCEYCAKAKALFASKSATYAYSGIDNQTTIPTGTDIYNSLVRLTHQDTLPNVWIGNKFIGGSDDLQALQDKGKLDGMLAAAGCTKSTPITTTKPPQTTKPTKTP